MATGYVGMQALEAALNAVYETGNVKCILMGAAHTPNEDTQQFYSGVSANELATANGYTAGGVAVTCTVTFNSSTNLFQVDFGQAQWTATGSLSAYTAVYIGWTGSAATSRILYQNDFTAQPTTATSSTFTANASNFTIDFP